MSQQKAIFAQFQISKPHFQHIQQSENLMKKRKIKQGKEEGGSTGKSEEKRKTV